MYRETCLAFAVCVVFSLVQSGYGLQCWICNSEHDVTCRDYFNKTKIELNRRYFDNAQYGNRQIQPVRNDPHLQTCDEMYTSSYNQKNVCLKKVYKGVHGINEVNRGCRLVPKSLKSGECPEDLLDRNREIQFCGTCEQDECNGAGLIKNSLLLATAVPLSLIIFLRH